MAVAKWKLFTAKVIILGIIPWFPALLDEEFDDFILLVGLVLLLVATPTKLFAVSWAVAKVESFVVSAWSSWGRFFEACFCERVSWKTSGSLVETSPVKFPTFSICWAVLSCLDGGKPPAVILGDRKQQTQQWRLQMVILALDVFSNINARHFLSRKLGHL